SFFFLHPPAPTELYTLSLHDALPISLQQLSLLGAKYRVQSRRDQMSLFRRRENSRLVIRKIFSEHADPDQAALQWARSVADDKRSEEHTSELQSRFDLVCRLLLEKKK